MKRIAMIVMSAFTAMLIVSSVAVAQAVEDSTTTDQTVDFQEAAQKQREAAKEKAAEQAKTREARQTEIKETVAARKLSIKKDICEAKKDKITEFTVRAVTRAEKFKTNIDTSYDRVVRFYETKELDMTNYETLVQNIETAKADAEAALSTLEATEVMVDCESQTIAGQLDEFRESVKQVRDTFKEYRKQLVELIKAMKASALTEATDTTSEETSNE